MLQCKYHRKMKLDSVKIVESGRMKNKVKYLLYLPKYIFLNIWTTLPLNNIYKDYYIIIISVNDYYI